MDNCAIHHDEEIRHIVEDLCGAKLIYLPPYSPDLNPIEQAFFAMKAFLRRQHGHSLAPEAREELIYEAIHHIKAESIECWVANCGYL
jgi:transposase